MGTLPHSGAQSGVTIHPCPHCSEPLTRAALPHEPPAGGADDALHADIRWAAYYLDGPRLSPGRCVNRTLPPSGIARLEGVRGPPATTLLATLWVAATDGRAVGLSSDRCMVGAYLPIKVVSMDVLILAVCGLGGLAVTAARGAGLGVAVVYLPVLLLLNWIKPFNEAPLPEISAQVAAMYGIFLGLLMRGESPFPARWNWADRLVVVLAAYTVVLQSVHGPQYKPFTAILEMCGEMLGPWFMLRRLMVHREEREAALHSVTWVACFVAFVALIEFRLRPYFFVDLLQSLGIARGGGGGALARGGFFRATATMAQPIDLGNTAFLLLALISTLALTTGRRLTSPLPLTGLIAAGLCLGTSMSFTPLSGMLVAGLILLMVRLKLYRAAMPAALFLGISMGIATSIFLDIELGPMNSESAIGGSFDIRVYIVQKAWGGVENAGWWGLGTLEARDVGWLLSVDNAYLLWMLHWGWLYPAVFALPVLALAYRAGQAMSAAPPAGVRPVAILLAVVLGTCAAMYTVFAGFVYYQLFMGVMGLTSGVCDALIEHRKRQDAVARAARLAAARAALLAESASSAGGSSAQMA